MKRPRFCAAAFFVVAAVFLCRGRSSDPRFIASRSDFPYLPAVVDLSELDIRPATERDLEEVLELLRLAELPTAGVAEHIRTFVVARDKGRLVGCGGCEAHAFAALLRSFAVVPDYRGAGLGRRLVREILDRLASRGLREFYLLTTTAEKFFARRGFKVIDRDEVHPQLLSSEEFQGACPETAVCMRLVMT